MRSGKGSSCKPEFRYRKGSSSHIGIQRVKVDKIESVVLERVRAGESYRETARVLKVNKNTVGSIVRRARADGALAHSVVG